MSKSVDLTEHQISSETIASGGMLTVKRDQVKLPNGHTSQREYVIHPGAVVVVPILPNGNVILEKQFRYPLHQVFIELPAGKIDANETVLTTGQRELLEETGYTASEWVRLGLSLIHIFKLMYFDEPLDYSPIVAALDMRIVLGVNAMALLVLGLMPQKMMEICAYAIFRSLS